MTENAATQGVYGVILAGGSGARFWPLSRELSPKQLLSIFGTESLIAQAAHRVGTFTGFAPGSTFVVSNERLVDELRNNLYANDDERLRDVHFLTEPMGRNTAPAIALAAAYVVGLDPDGVMIVLPSDHVLDGGDEWHDVLETATALALDDYLVTVGVHPTRPETGYGYIRFGAVLPEFTHGCAVGREVDAFVEKPDAGNAARMIAEGDYLWNAGIFVMRAATLLERLEAATPEGARIAEVARAVAAMPADEWTSDGAREAYEALPSVPIDTALFEHADRVAVVPAELAWSDVGSFLSLADLEPADEHGNVRVGRGVDVDSRNCVVYAQDRLVATLGVSDAIVVDTADATLVCHRDRTQDVRAIVDALKSQGADEVSLPRTSVRPWGTWTTLLRSPGYQIKIIEVKPGARVSLQSHAHRAEHWIVVDGAADVQLDRELVRVNTNESVYIPVGAIHRMTNPGERMLRIIEVQVGDYLGEDDIVRHSDDYHRI